MTETLDPKILLRAASNNDTELFLILLHGILDALKVDQIGHKCIKFAITNNNTLIIKALASLDDNWFNLHDAPPNEASYMNLAARHGKFDIVKLLIENGRLDPAFTGPRDMGETALHYACRLGNIEAFDWLIELQRVKDTVDAQNKSGRTPISLAAEFGRSEIVDRLLKFDTVDPWRSDNEGNTALEWAMKKGHDAIGRTIANDIQKKQEAQKR